MKSAKKSALKKGVPDFIAKDAWIAKAPIIKPQGIVFSPLYINISGKKPTVDKDGFKQVPAHRAARRRGTQF